MKNYKIFVIYTGLNLISKKIWLLKSRKVKKKQTTLG